LLAAVALVKDLTCIINRV